VEAAVEHYSAGKYPEAERAALGVVDGAGESGDGLEERARARWVLAFSAARRKDFPLARERFASLRKEAAAVPEAKVSDEAGDGEPTLEEEAAYQHAVLTLALASQPAGKGVQAFRSSGVQGDAGSAGPAARREAGDPDSSGTPGRGTAPGVKTKAGVSGGSHPSSFILHPSRADAEREFMAFLREYPESPLVHAAVRRIARMHGGDVPEEAERLWRRAMKIQRSREAERERERSMCGPEVLAEILAREVKSKKVKGKSGSEGVQEDRAHDPATSPPHHPTAEELAREMGTDARGTTLQALAETARRHGFAAKGLRLTFAGLLKVASGNGVQVFGSSVFRRARVFRCSGLRVFREGRERGEATGSSPGGSNTHTPTLPYAHT
jgi:hypothetical protein